MKPWLGLKSKTPCANQGWYFWTNIFKLLFHEFVAKRNRAMNRRETNSKLLKKQKVPWFVWRALAVSCRFTNGFVSLFYWVSSLRLVFSFVLYGRPINQINNVSFAYKSLGCQARGFVFVVWFRVRRAVGGIEDGTTVRVLLLSRNSRERFWLR